MFLKLTMNDFNEVISEMLRVSSPDTTTEKNTAKNAKDDKTFMVVLCAPAR